MFPRARAHVTSIYEAQTQLPFLLILTPTDGATNHGGKRVQGYIVDDGPELVRGRRHLKQRVLRMLGEGAVSQ